jgi:hypothetical protein
MVFSQTCLCVSEIEFLDLGQDKNGEDGVLSNIFLMDVYWNLK